MEPPDPFPNSEVKRLSADGSVVRPCESRSSSAPYLENPLCRSKGGFGLGVWVRKQQGLTLIELILGILIIGVFLFLAYPAYNGLMHRVESWRIKKEIKAILRQARVEAIMRKKDIIVCLAGDDGACSPQGQVFLKSFVDTNYNNLFDTKDVLVYNQKLDLQYGMLMARTSLNRGYIKFMGDTAKPRGNFGHIRYCSFLKNEGYSYQVVVNHHGRVSERLENATNIGC